MMDPTCCPKANDYEAAVNELQKVVFSLHQLHSRSTHYFNPKLESYSTNNQPTLEEVFDTYQYFRRALRFVNRLAQPCAAGDPVGEPARELLHLADGVGQFFLDQHLTVRADHLVAVALAGLVVDTSEFVRPYVSAVLFDLPKNPRVRRRGAPDHHRVAAS